MIGDPKNDPLQEAYDLLAHYAESANDFGLSVNEYLEKGGHIPRDYQLAQYIVEQHEMMQALADKPASPLPWIQRDATIFDANGESILGLDEDGFPAEFPCERDADFIFRAVQKYIGR